MSATACERASTELVAFLDGELAADERRPVSEHVSSCLVCRREMERLSTLKSWLAEMPRVEPGATFAADFARRLAAEPTPIATRRGGAGRLRWMIPAFAAAAVLALALRSFLDVPAPPTAPAAPARERVVAAAPAPKPDARVAARPGAEPEAPQVADVDALRLEDLPPELREHPELFLRLPVVKRLDTLEYLGSLHERGSPADDGAG